MGFLNFLAGVGRQLNPLDNGATFKNSKGNGQNKSVASQAVGSTLNFLKNNVTLPVNSAIKPLQIASDVAKPVGNALVSAGNKLTTSTQNIPVVKTVAGKVIAPVISGYGTTAQHTGELLHGVNPYHGSTPQVLGQIGNDVLNAASVVPAAGAVKGIKEGITGTGSFWGNLAKTGAEGAGIGAGYGVANAAEQKGVTPGQVVKAGAEGALIGGASAVALPLLSKGFKELSNHNKAIVNEQASKVSGLKPENVVNSNEAGTLRDWADYKKGSYKPNAGKINELAMQARNAAKTAGIDITSGSADDVSARIEEYISKLKQHTDAANAIAQGGYVNIPGNADELAKSTDVKDIKSKLEGDVHPTKLDTTAQAVAATKDPNIVKGIVNGETSVPKEVPPPEIPNPKDVKAAINAEVQRQPISDISNPKSVTELTTAPSLQDATVAKTPAQQIIDALNGAPASKGTPAEKGAEAIRKAQDLSYSQERAQRIAASQNAGANLPGLEGHKAELAALKGELQKQDYVGLSQKLQPAEQDNLFTQLRQQVKDNPNIKGYNELNTNEALRKVIYGDSGVPQPREIELLRKAFGDNFASSVQNDIHLTSSQKVKYIATQVLGAPKSIMASYDVSGGLRQGAVLGSRFPKEFADATKAQLQFFGSQKAFDASMQEIASRPNAALYDKMGIALTGASAHPEEAFVSNIAERIPGLGKGIAASDRAYTGMLTKLRADSADHILSDLKAAGIDPNTMTAKELKDIGTFINTASGRGNLGSLEKHAQSLGQALFSPRLWKSRLDQLNPVYYAKLGPVARKYALQSAASFASITATVLGLATLAGAKVETDARSSDFLKIKVGNTRFDILGGFQQNIVLANRELTGEKKSSMSGAITKLGDKYGGADRLSILSDFVQNKENPVLAAGQRILKGKDIGGNPVNPVSEIGKLFIPLGFQDTYSAIKDSGAAAGIAKSIPGYIGIGNQTYSASLNAKENQTIKRLKQAGAPPEKIQAYTEYYKTASVAAGTRQNVSDAINKALTNNDIAKAKKLATDYNNKYASAFKDWASKYSQYSDKTLTKDYTSNKINLTPASIKARQKAIKDKNANL